MAPLQKVILWNAYGSAAVYGENNIDYVDAEVDEEDEYSFGREGFEQFLNQFRLVGRQFLSDPNEPFYQGVNFVTVWQRLSDGKFFGYPYWESIHKHGDMLVEPNGDSHGIDWQDPRGEAFVFVEVEPFTITGYKFDE